MFALVTRAGPYVLSIPSAIFPSFTSVKEQILINSDIVAGWFTYPKPGPVPYAWTEDEGIGCQALMGLNAMPAGNWTELTLF